MLIQNKCREEERTKRERAEEQRSREQAAAQNIIRVSLFNPEHQYFQHPDKTKFKNYIF
jgi:hypothetical protein